MLPHKSTAQIRAGDNISLIFSGVLLSQCILIFEICSHIIVVTYLISFDITNGCQSVISVIRIKRERKLGKLDLGGGITLNGFQ